VTAKQTAGLLLPLVLLAGCGGGSGSGSTTTTPPTSRQSFVERVERVCRDAASGAERVAGLRRLRPPLAFKDLYGHWLHAEEDALAATEALSDPAQDAEGDPLVPLVIAQGKIVGYAQRLGAEVCATGPAVRIRP
jgi:hypothetical protein